MLVTIEGEKEKKKKLSGNGLMNRRVQATLDAGKYRSGGSSGDENNCLGEKIRDCKKRNEDSLLVPLLYI